MYIIRVEVSRLRMLYRGVAKKVFMNFIGGRKTVEPSMLQ
jgi:hypothetical protein